MDPYIHLFCCFRWKGKFGLYSFTLDASRNLSMLFNITYMLMTPTFTLNFRLL